MVHKPEEILTPGVTPFEGISVYGIYYESEADAVGSMVDTLMDEHPDWAFKISNLHKMQIGFNVPKAPSNPPKRRK